MIDVVFFDVGGVVLTNGWDTAARRKTCERFGLDPAEFEDRHQFLVDRFETGRIGLGEYLARTVFYRPRSFEVTEFEEAMRSVSQPLPGGLQLARAVAAAGARLATLNNESRPLNEYRIERFGLDDVFESFFSSCYLGVKKPDQGIYRIALDVTGADPARAVFIDDRPINLEGADTVGMHTIHHVGLTATRAALEEVGLTGVV